MSEQHYSPQGTPQIAPGWYPDGSGATRWWNGAEWTEHVQPPLAPAGPAMPAYAAERRRLPDATPVDNAWVWVVALASFATAPLIFMIDMNGYMRALMTGDPAGIMAYFGTLFLLTAVGWAMLALCIVAAFRDYKRLLSLGVERPFHWAFAFLGSTVYLIGRHVVLRKVLRTPGWPLWVHLAAYLLYLVVVTFWTMSLTQSMISEIVYYGQYA